MRRCSVPPLPAGRITTLEALDIWKRHFIVKGVPEPEHSSNYIIAHLIGAKTVSWKDLILRCPGIVLEPTITFYSIIICFHRLKVSNTQSYQSFLDKIRQSRYGSSAPNGCQGITFLLHHLHMCVSRSILYDRTTLVSMFVWSRMPVQYVIEEWDFRDLTLKMRPPVFIPRPETEVLSQKILQRSNLNPSDEL